MGIAAKRPNRLRRGRIPDRNVEKRCDLEGESSNMAAECSRRRRLNIHQSLGPRSIPVSGGDVRREDLAQSIEDIGSQRKIDGGRILLQIFPAFCARNRYDVLALRQHPGQRQLTRRPTRLLQPTVAPSRPVQDCAESSRLESAGCCAANRPTQNHRRF